MTNRKNLELLDTIILYDNPRVHMIVSTNVNVLKEALENKKHRASSDSKQFPDTGDLRIHD